MLLDKRFIFIPFDLVQNWSFYFFFCTFIYFIKQIRHAKNHKRTLIFIELFGLQVFKKTISWSDLLILIFTFVLDSTDSKHSNLLDTILRDNIIADQKTRDSEFRENCKLKWETDNCLKSLKGWNVVQANDNCIILKKTVTDILRLQNYWSILIKIFVCFYILICQYSYAFHE